MNVDLETVKGGRKEVLGIGWGCIHGRFGSERAVECMEAVQGVSLSCAKAYFP